MDKHWDKARGNSRAWRVAGAALASIAAAVAWAQPQEAGARGSQGAPQSQGARLAEGEGALAARAAARVVAAADAAQAAGLGSDPASLARMGALPGSLVKWGQIKNPWVDGQFMDIQYAGSGKAARVAVVASGIPSPLCKDAILELAMRPEIEKVEAGAWSLEVGEPWKIQDVDGLCLALAAGPVKLWAKREAIER